MKSPRSAPTAALLLAAAWLPTVGPAPASAQAPGDAAGDTAAAAGDRPEPSVEAVRRRGRIAIDGRLAESAWRRAPSAGSFVQAEPVEGAEPERSTEVRVLYDDEALYVGARMHDDPSAVADQLVRRDGLGQYDHFEVLLDPNRDGQRGYLFRVGASGVELDAYVFRDVRMDLDWDAVWRSAVHRDSAGWSAEMRIPLSQIRYESRDTAQAWGVNFERRRVASASVSHFSLVSRTVEGLVSQAGRLTGLVLTESEPRLELVPFVAGQLFTAPAGPDDPFFDGSETEARAGLNARYGVGSNFSLHATVNPDFGQVELDPAVVNLTAFETFFPEKRPFFVQDARVLDFDLGGRNARLFFSRRIGKAPTRERLPGAAFSEAPDRTTILGAAKFTGRTESGLSVGVLGAATQEETGRAVLGDGGEIRSFLAEPAAQYGVARIQQDFRGGSSRVGGILTAMRRDLPDGGGPAGLPSEAFTGGVDFEHAWGGPSDRRWSLSGYVATSHVRGSPEAMVAIQTNPQHYHQRPDADYLSVDSTATHLTGVNWNVVMARQSGEHWTWNASLEHVGRDLAVNDLGFYDQGPQLDFTGGLTYREIDPGRLFRNWSVGLFTFHEFRTDVYGRLASPGEWPRSYKDGSVSLNASAELNSNWSVDLGLDFGPRSLSDTETRGGPLMTEPGSIGFEAGLTTDPRATVSLSPRLSWRDRLAAAGGTVELGTDVVVRPEAGIELRMQPRVAFRDDPSQFVASSEAVPYGPTFGTRYVFADLDRTELALETRINAAFTPDLSLELFLQPLISAGDFVRYKQLERPATFEFRPFEEGTAVVTGSGVACSDGATCVRDDERFVDFDGDGTPDLSFPDRDFNVRSLRGNAVLRWEYLPGSTLFLVWQQNRRAEADVGDFDLGRDLDGLLGAGAENTFVVKVSHFLDL